MERILWRYIWKTSTRSKRIYKIERKIISNKIKKEGHNVFSQWLANSSKNNHCARANAWPMEQK